MKKFLLPTLLAFPMLFLTGFASPISLSLFQDGFSILDKLFLIGLGITFLGVLFLCIAFCKSKSKKEKPVESPFDDYLEEDTQEDSIPEETISEDETESVAEAEESESLSDIPEEVPEEIAEESVVEEITPAEETPEEIPEETPEEIPEEPLEELSEETPEETTADVAEDVPEEASEEVPEKEVEEMIYPKLILTHVHTNDFVILPLYPETTVGRKTDNDLVLSDVTISGLHCKILNENGVIYVVDENSTNGTFVNDERISEKAQLHHGDKLTLGKQEFNISINE